MQRTSPSSAFAKAGDNVIFENAAVGHQLGADRNDMVAPGKTSDLAYLYFYLIPSLSNRRFKSPYYLYRWNYWYEAYSRTWLHSRKLSFVDLC